MLDELERLRQGLGKSFSDDEHPKLNKLLADPIITIIIVEHRDRLTRFGWQHLAVGLEAGKRREVIRL